MNSEELEQSLRAEFENYLKGVLVDMRSNVLEFQNKIDAEFDQHRSNLDEAFREFTERFDPDHQFDNAFRESVIEHLRLARDEGAKITATAIAEAEDLERASSPNIDLGDIKEAVNDLSTKDSQSAILKTLIYHAAKFAPRGAFFIIKNEQFLGWRVFGKEAGDGDLAVRDIQFPVAGDSILGASVRSQSITEASYGTYSEDGVFLGPLHFGGPDRMYAIPLVARGRAVAVLYADYGHEGVSVNTDALEMLVRVAGLTVEMLASAKAVRSGADVAPHEDLSEAHNESEEPKEEPAEHVSNVESFEPAPEAAYQEPEVAYQEPEYVPEVVDAAPSLAEPADQAPVSDFSFSPSYEIATEYVPEQVVEESEPQATFETGAFESTLPVVEFAPFQSPALDETELSHELRSYQPEAEEMPEAEALVTEAEVVFDEPAAEEPNRFETPPFDQPVEKFEPVAYAGGGVTTAPAIEKVASPAVGTRLSDRHVDLPIEVPEDERRLHNDARRFARLLVSEIKLYNEKKVQEGRESNDLYERLREAIDRSREMYDKRVQPPVASKFDYFHYELVNSLAEGDDARLGPGYKGAKV